jgi:hypothetical protein
MATASFVSVNQSLLYIPDDAKATSARVGFLLPADVHNPPQRIALENSLLEYPEGVYLFFAALPYDAINPALLANFIQAVYTYLDDLMLPGVRFVWLTNPQDFSAGLIGTPLQVVMQGNYAVTLRAIALPLAPNLSLRISGGTQIAADPDGTKLLGSATDPAPLAVIVTPQGSQPQMVLPLRDNMLTIAMTGNSVLEGCLGLGLLVDGDGLTALDIGLRYFTPDLNLDTPGYIQSFRYPLFNPAPGNTVALSATLDPLAPLDPTRSSFDFVPGQTIPSFFCSVLDGPVTLEPQSSAQLVFAVKLAGQTIAAAPGGAAAPEPYYLTPQGEFNFTITDAQAQVTEDSPALLNCLACGFSGIEYVSLPQGTGTMIFRAGQSAFSPSQMRSSTIAPFEQTVLYQGLTDAATTSWAYIRSNETIASYYAQPDGSILHQPQASNPSISPAFLTYLPLLAGTLPHTISPAQVFPLVPYKGITADPLVTTLEPFAQLEKQVLNPIRRNLIYEINSRLDRRLIPTAQESKQGTTPQGLLLTLEDTQWSRLLLAQTTDSAQTVIPLQLNNIRGALQAGLQANQAFMVVSSPTRFLADSDIPNYRITIQTKTDLAQSQDPVVPAAIIDAVWNNMKNVLYTSLADFQQALKPILGTDYPTYVEIITRVAAVFTISIQQWAFDLSPYFWSNFNTILIFKFANNRLQDLVQDTSSWVQGPALNDDIISTQQQLQAFIDDALANQSTEMDYFKTTVLSDPSWNGILALRCRIPLSALPAQVEGLAAGINVNQFFAHHVGITVTPINASNGSFTVNDSSLFGLINYNDPSDIADQSVDYNFKVLNLRVLFENSGVGSFSSQIVLLINKLFLEPVTLKNTSAGGSITLNGVYQQHNDQGSYVFTSQDETVFQVNSQVLDSVEIQKAAFLTLIPPAGVQEGTNVQTRFVFWGNLQFKALAGFDLFSFGSTNDASGGLSYANLAVEMAFPADLPSHKTFAFDAEQVTFDISTSIARPESLYKHFPLKLSGLVQADQEVTPANLGYMPVNGPLIGSQLAPPWYGLLYELNLGSPGALASQVGFTATLLTAWKPNPSNYTIFIGLRIPGVSGGKREISIEGIIKITFGDVRFVVNAPSYILQIRAIALNILSLSFPPGQTDMILFGNPNEQDSSTLGWYAAYKKANQGSPPPARQIRASQRHKGT